MNEIIEKEIRIAFRQKLKELMLDEELVDDIDRIYKPIANLVCHGLNTEGKTQIIGINGAQGAGKTTFSNLLKVVLETGFDVRVASLSIDDLYLKKKDRISLAGDVHPLLITRGVPGTHDISLGEEVLSSLCNASPTTETLIPRFNKAIDDRRPTSEWERYVGKPDVILFDGWIMGAIEQKEEDLKEPINTLEAEEDPQCIWRKYVNDQLREIYRPFFDKLGLLVMLQVPSFDKIYEWRTLQEHKLLITTQNTTHSCVMNDEAILRFISHYERLTRHILAEMPSRADMLLRVNDNHRIFV